VKLKYGFIGLGNLGGHLAASLLRNGFDLVVTDLDKSLAERHLAQGARWAASPAELAGQVDHVFTCLPSPAASENVLAQILPAMKPGAAWIENSTLGRDEIVRLAAKAEARGVRMLEAPVTGGVHLAARGEITVLVGGHLELFELHKPALQAIGNQIFHMGPLGSAAIIKVITNMLAFIHLVADGEALMLATALCTKPRGN
jgi:3-hydroxyisobutyrate dehydrogenase